MLATTAAEVLASLRPGTPIDTPIGPGVVLFQLRSLVCAVVRGRVIELERYLVEPVAVDFTAADLAWFRRPLEGVS